MPDEDPKPRKFRLFKDHEVTVSTDIAEEWDKVKSHFQRNKAVYISGGVFLTVGLLAGRNFQLNPGSAPQIVNNIRPSIEPVFNNAPVFNNVVEAAVNNGGPVAKIVKATLPDGTIKIFEMSADAARWLAEEKDIPFDKAQWLVSRCANGHISDAFKYKFENLGLRALG